MTRAVCETGKIKSCICYQGGYSDTSERLETILEGRPRTYYLTAASSEEVVREETL
jgi:hypothetical protein